MKRFKVTYAALWKVQSYPHCFSSYADPCEFISIMINYRRGENSTMWRFSTKTPNCSSIHILIQISLLSCKRTVVICCRCCRCCSRCCCCCVRCGFRYLFMLEDNEETTDAHIDDHDDDDNKWVVQAMSLPTPPPRQWWCRHCCHPLWRCQRRCGKDDCPVRDAPSLSSSSSDCRSRTTSAGGGRGCHLSAPSATTHLSLLAVDVGGRQQHHWRWSIRDDDGMDATATMTWLVCHRDHCSSRCDWCHRRCHHHRFVVVIIIDIVAAVVAEAVGVVAVVVVVVVVILVLVLVVVVVVAATVSAVVDPVGEVQQWEMPAIGQRPRCYGYPGREQEPHHHIIFGGYICLWWQHCSHLQTTHFFIFLFCFDHKILSSQIVRSWERGMVSRHNNFVRCFLLLTYWRKAWFMDKILHS